MNSTKVTAPAQHAWDDNGLCQRHGTYCSMAASEPTRTAEQQARHDLCTRIEAGELTDAERQQVAFMVRLIGRAAEHPAPGCDEQRRVRMAGCFQVLTDDYRKLVPAGASGDRDAGGSAGARDARPGDQS